MPELEFTESELEAVTMVFKQYETGLREACIDVKAGSIIYFTYKKNVSDPKYALCLLCNKKLEKGVELTATMKTPNLKHHLKTVHPETFSKCLWEPASTEFDSICSQYLSLLQVLTYL